MVSYDKAPISLDLWFLKTNPQDHWTDGFLTLLRTTSCLTERKNNNKIIKKRSKHRKSPNFVLQTLNMFITCLDSYACNTSLDV
jgi:hypothetical protein